MIGFYTLFKKEILRFWKVGFQTLAAPMITALLYQLIFSHAVGKSVEALPDVAYNAFLIPGLAMMSMTQNAFANSSSSLIQSRITGNLVFILLPPLSVSAFFSAYVGASVVRGLLVGAGVIAATAWFGLPLPHNFIWITVFALLGCTMMGALCLLAGIVAEKFDQLAAFSRAAARVTTSMATSIASSKRRAGVDGRSNFPSRAARRSRSPCRRRAPSGECRDRRGANSRGASSRKARQ